MFHSLLVASNRMHTFSVIVYARVSKGYDFINEKINEWYSTDGPPVTGCTDLGGFYGSKGVSYNCIWYAEDFNSSCKFSNALPNGGMTANEACCACGGGVVLPTQRPTSMPTRLPTRSPTSPPTYRPTINPTRRGI